MTLKNQNFEMFKEVSLMMTLFSEKMPISTRCILYARHHKGAFTNYVYKRRGVGGQTNRLCVNFYTIENVNGRG